MSTYTVGRSINNVILTNAPRHDGWDHIRTSSQEFKSCIILQLLNIDMLLCNSVTVGFNTRIYFNLGFNFNFYSICKPFIAVVNLL